jgi:pimeloyl-ACP methyl ester carboxylesterase
LFFPSHHQRLNGLTPWKTEGRVIGYSSEAPVPESVWLMLHGNGGQAADRAYARPRFSERDSVYILEYPGYGQRDGRPSRDSFDTAAVEAYLLLRNSFPKTPVCVVGESIGSGPACALARQAQPPDKIVLVVPFDKLAGVVADHLPLIPAGLVLGASWDNIAALSGYHGPVEIFAAKEDTVIPNAHARALAASVPSAKFHVVDGGHNDWSRQRSVEIRNP